MRIALVHYSAPPVIGGVERVMAEQARMLRGMGHEVDLVSGSGDHVIRNLTDRLLDAPGKGARAPCSSEGRANASLEYYHLIIVHNIFTMPFDLDLTRRLCGIAATSTETKWINWVHDVAAVNPNYAHLPWTSSEYEMFRSPPLNCLHVAVSQVRRKEFCSATSQDFEQCRVIPNGIDTAGVLGLSSRIVQFCNQERLLERDLILVHPTRILRRKNIELGLRVAHALRARDLNVAYLISGAPDPHNADGCRYQEELQALIEKLDIKEHAFFLGEGGSLDDNDIRSLYALADALFFPSKAEGFGLPIMEAALHGLPIFCSDIAAHREIDSDGQLAAFFSLDESSEALAAQLRIHRGVSARRRRRTEIVARFDWSKIAVTYFKPLLNDVT